MSVSLEPLVPQEEPAVVEETEEAIEEPPVSETIVEEAPDEANAPAVEEVTAAAAPAPKKRGGPKRSSC